MHAHFFPIQFHLTLSDLSEGYRNCLFFLSDSFKSLFISYIKCRLDISYKLTENLTTIIEKYALFYQLFLS